MAERKECEAWGRELQAMSDIITQLWESSRPSNPSQSDPHPPAVPLPVLTITNPPATPTTASPSLFDILACHQPLQSTCEPGPSTQEAERTIDEGVVETPFLAGVESSDEDFTMDDLVVEMIKDQKAPGKGLIFGGMGLWPDEDMQDVTILMVPGEMGRPGGDDSKMTILEGGGAESIPGAEVNLEAPSEPLPTIEQDIQMGSESDCNDGTKSLLVKGAKGPLDGRLRERTLASITDSLAICKLVASGQSCPPHPS